jgi:hypothetical protein
VTKSSTKIGPAPTVNLPPVAGAPSSSPDHGAILRRIILDPNASPRDRIAAMDKLEQLERARPAPPPPEPTTRPLAKLTAEVDTHTAVTLEIIATDPRAAGDYPQTAAWLRRYADRADVPFANVATFATDG